MPRILKALGPPVVSRRRVIGGSPLPWQRLLAGFPWFRGEGRFPIDAYSEFLPPPRLGRKPYPFAEPEIRPFDAGEHDRRHVSDRARALELRPAMLHLARRLLRT